MKQRRRTAQPPWQKKPGRYGTLYRFRIVYRDHHDPASPDFEQFTWAYDAGHAEDKFYDTDDTGWRILSVDRVRESR